MRIALVGLSSPCGYIYDHKRLFTQKQPWHWNPILESPLGLATLFDEVWFLHRALCPQTMRNLEFVRFLNEDSKYKSMVEDEIARFEVDGSLSKNRKMLALKPVDSGIITRFGEIIRRASGMTPGADMPIDNHSDHILFGQTAAVGNPGPMKNLVLDLIMSQKLLVRFRKRVELVTNTFTDTCILPEGSNLARLALSHMIVVKRIPMLQTARGPVLDNIRRIRENKYLEDFRKKVSLTPSESDSEEINHLVHMVENEFVDYRNEVLLEHQAKAGLIESISRNCFSMVASKILPPGILEAADLIEASQTRLMNWTAFLASL